MQPGIDFLNSLTAKGINPTLGNVRAFYGKSGLKPDYFKVTVAGTNGKGSTVGYLSRVFTECGYKTGSIISPHISRVNERILLNGQEISDKDLDSVLLEVQGKIEATGISLTYFEALLFASLFHFERERIDVAVLEVGLGGRFDAVNVLNQDISVITSISYDHQHFLGNTLGEIASEKFAIVKEGNSVIASLPDKNLQGLLRGKCSEKDARLLLLNQGEWSGGKGQGAREGKEFSLHDHCYSCSDGFVLGNIQKKALGGKQWENIALVLTAYREFTIRTGNQFREEAVLKAIREYVPRGRFEKVSGSPAIYLDVAHNEDSLNVLLNNVKEELTGKEKVLIAAFSADKNWQPFVRNALEVFDVLLFCRYQCERSETPENIERHVRTLDGKGKEVRYFQSIAEARKEIASLGGNVALVVCGSFHTIDDFVR